MDDNVPISIPLSLSSSITNRYAGEDSLICAALESCNVLNKCPMLERHDALHVKAEYGQDM